MLVDSHCHLTYPGLAEDVAAVLERAAAAGVARMITVGTDAVDHQRVLRLLEAFPNLCGALGVHPHHAADANEAVVAALEETFRIQPRMVAVGECGLDYFEGHGSMVPPGVQAGMFRAHLKLAERLGKPVILHVRDAHPDALAIMREFSRVRFVIHCFTGTAEECRSWVDLGAYVGITGIVTYKSAANVRAAAALIPADRLLVETDAPYLSPEPVRKIKTNEPAFVAHVAHYLAALRQVSFEELARQTSANAVGLFGAALGWA